jgi:hypothetical protein
VCTFSPSHGRRDVAEKVNLSRPWREVRPDVIFGKDSSESSDFLSYHLDVDIGGAAHADCLSGSTAEINRAPLHEGTCQADGRVYASVSVSIRSAEQAIELDERLKQSLKRHPAPMENYSRVYDEKEGR